MPAAMVHQGQHLLVRDQVLPHHRLTIDTQRPRGEDIPIHQVLHLRDVVEQLPWSSRSSKYLHPLVMRHL